MQKIANILIVFVIFIFLSMKLNADIHSTSFKCEWNLKGLIQEVSVGENKKLILVNDGEAKPFCPRLLDEKKDLINGRIYFSESMTCIFFKYEKMIQSLTIKQIKFDFEKKQRELKKWKFDIDPEAVNVLIHHLPESSNETFASLTNSKPLIKKNYRSCIQIGSTKSDTRDKAETIDSQDNVKQPFPK